MSETRKYRKFTAQQKTEIVLAALRGHKSHMELCREHEIKLERALGRKTMEVEVAGELLRGWE